MHTQRGLPKAVAASSLKSISHLQFQLAGQQERAVVLKVFRTERWENTGNSSLEIDSQILEETKRIQYWVQFTK